MENPDDLMASRKLEQLCRLPAIPDHSRPGCPAEYEWDLLTEGRVAEERETELLEHVSACDACAAHLRPALALAEPLTAEHQELLSVLPSSSPAGKRRLAEEAAGKRPFPS